MGNNKVKDLTNMAFGKLKVIKRVEDIKDKRGYNHNAWECECSCENKTHIIALGSKLLSGRKISCGCDSKERIRKVAFERRKRNKYDLSGEYGIGWTSNTNEEFYFDLEDYDKIKDYTWIRSPHHNKPNGYLTTTMENTVDGKRKAKTIFFHKLIVDYPIVDHKNRNKLDNRKENLRNANSFENSVNKEVKSNNTSGFIGVCLFKKSQKWNARINVNKKRIFLGQYSSKEDAIKARLKAEKEYYGEFAPQKHLFEEYGIK